MLPKSEFDAVTNIFNYPATHVTQFLSTSKLIPEIFSKDVIAKFYETLEPFIIQNQYNSLNSIPCLTKTLQEPLLLMFNLFTRNNHSLQIHHLKVCEVEEMLDRNMVKRAIFIFNNCRNLLNFIIGYNSSFYFSTVMLFQIVLKILNRMCEVVSLLYC
jgi:hypothetical protein